MSSILNSKSPVVIKSLAKKYDSDGSNTINSFELGNLISDMGFTVSKTQVDALLMLIDKDASGSINIDEFVQWWTQTKITDVLNNQNTMHLITEASKLFKKYDVDGSRKLKQNEVTNLLRDLAQCDSTNSVKDMIASLDRTGDQEIDFHEFCVWLRWF
ncbi:calcium-binding protein CML [Acrasis kona]|uniref:Calcium-binding protein CML n=1 Tax=Acrasis kona TaxID=1008807 RepID=A0AAW2ZFD4_9EUKA